MSKTSSAPYSHWSKYSDESFEFEYPTLEVTPYSAPSECTVSLHHHDHASDSLPPFIFHLKKEPLKDHQSGNIAQYTKESSKHMLYLLKDSGAKSDFPGNVNDTLLDGLPAKESIYRLQVAGCEELVTYSCWAVDSVFAYVLVFQAVPASFGKLKDSVCKRIVKSLVLREAHWQNVVLEPHYLKGFPCGLYLPRDAISVGSISSSSSNSSNSSSSSSSRSPSEVKFVFSNGDKNATQSESISLTVGHKKVNSDDLAKYLRKEDLRVAEKIKLAKQFPAYQLTKLEADGYKISAYSIIEGVLFYLNLSTKKKILRVKTIVLWKSILELFTFDNL